MNSIFLKKLIKITKKNPFEKLKNFNNMMPILPHLLECLVKFSNGTWPELDENIILRIKYNSCANK